MCMTILDLETDHVSGLREILWAVRKLFQKFLILMFQVNRIRVYCIS